MEVLVSRLSKYRLPLDDLGRVQHPVHSVHLFDAGISHQTGGKGRTPTGQTWNQLGPPDSEAVFSAGRRGDLDLNTQSTSLKTRLSRLMRKTLHTAVSSKDTRVFKAHPRPVSTFNRGERVTDYYAVASPAVVQCHLMLLCPMKSSLPATL